MSTVAEDETFVRECGSRIYAFEEFPLSEEGVQVGPIFFHGLTDAPEVDPLLLEPDKEGGLSPLKYPTTIDFSGGRSVILSIAGEQRFRAALTYDVNAFAASLDEGTGSVEFTTCEDATLYPQFNGGFVVASPGCVRIDVFTDESLTLPVAQLDVPFATPACP